MRFFARACALSLLYFQCDRRGAAQALSLLDHVHAWDQAVVSAHKTVLF
jgi:hypothetical protein